MSDKHVTTSEASESTTIQTKKVARGAAAAFLGSVITGLGKALGEGLGEALVQGLLG